ncbi:MAG: hypothetical protein K9L75_03540 [Spirochaetia bacterium]|nr:hypothetical protein [Spirochaetales bacterium]MCF7944593.1 hypothetical protein [Spirochaetia bacterium]
MRFRLLLTISFLVAIGFLLFLPAGLEKERVLRPLWSMDLYEGRWLSGDRPDAEGDKPRVIPYRLGDVYGYVSTEGELLFREKVLADVAIDQKRSANYQMVSRNIMIRGQEGLPEVALQTSQYPILQDGRIFSIRTDRRGLTEWEGDGSVRWTRSFQDLITAVDVCGSHLTLGLLDGRAVIINETGETEVEYDTTGSRLDAVFGVAVSPDRRLWAVVAGIDPQRLLLLEQGEQGAYQPREVIEFSDSFRREVFVGFGPEGRYLFFERPAGLLVIDALEQERYELPVSGDIRDLNFSPEGKEMALLTADSKRALFQVYSLPPRSRLESTLSGTVHSMHRSGSYVLLGIDSGLFLYRFEEG